MAMKRCPDCGEKYSDTYRFCPFCEEEQYLREGRQQRRRTPHGRQFSVLTLVLVILIVLMGSLLIYLLWGGDSDKDTSADNPGVTDFDPVQPGTSDTEEPGDEIDPGVMPDDPDDPVTSQPTDYELTNQLPLGITLNKTDYTTNVGDVAVQLTASGGNGNYSWVSQDASIASVDSNGKVTAISGGTVNVLVTDGDHKGVCIVRVRGGSTAPTTPTTPTNPSEGGSGGAHTLNREDMTLKVGERFQLKLGGVTSALTWTTGNSNVASVSADGTVKGIGTGNTTVKVTWDGGSASCIVRVSN